MIAATRDIENDSIRFGTDGWRAVIGKEFTFANLERAAQAYADYVNCENRRHNSGAPSTNGAPLVVVGCDRRRLSEQFARRTAEILAGNEIKVALFDEAVPTPLVSWAVRENRAAGGVVITASHNPPEFNGFKIKAPWGGSAASDTTRAVESLLGRRAPVRKSVSAAENSEIARSAAESYRRQITNCIDLERLRRARRTVIIDPMHGTGGRWTESFLRGGELKPETMRAERDPLFGGAPPEPIDRYLGALKKRVRETGALLGLATDGDADRLGAVNERGATMTMHEVAPLLLLHLVRSRKMSGGVARTFSQSVLVNRIAAAYNLPLYETPVGFKYIADLMLRENVLIGAEESGGIGVQGHIPERDGILNSLLLLEAVVAAGKPPSEIVRDIRREFGEFYFDRRDASVEARRGRDFVETLAHDPPPRVAGEKVSGVETLDGTKLLFADESWLLFRQSGTEPVLRIYCEATSVFKMNSLLEVGERLAESF